MSGVYGIGVLCRLHGLVVAAKMLKQVLEKEACHDNRYFYLPTSKSMEHAP